MRRVTLGLAALMAACAVNRETPDDAHDSFSRVRQCDVAGAGSATGVSHEIAWQAACRAMAWGGGLVRVDAKARSVGRGDAMEVHVVPYPDGSTGIWYVADTRRMGDFTCEIFMRRFFQAIEILESGKPLPLDPPPLPPERT